MRVRTGLVLSLFLVVPGCDTGSSAQRLSSDIVVDARVEHQTITGWEATAFIAQWGCPESAFNMDLVDRFRGAVMDSAASLGLTRLRLEVRPSAERPDDPFADFRARKYDYSGYRRFFYVAINDNDDPNVIDPSGFHFSEVDFTVDQVVTPLRERLARDGQRLYVNLNFVQFGRTDEFQHRFEPEEYGEFILAAFLHLRDKYGWVPDAVEVILEPDNGAQTWTPVQVGEALVAAGRRLEQAGFSPEFIAPSTKAMSEAIRYVDEMMDVPGVRDYLKVLSYHRYGGVSDGNLDKIGKWSRSHRLGTGMLEKIGSGYEDLHRDLKAGDVSAWQQFTLSGCRGQDDQDRGGRYLLVDISDPQRPIVTRAGRTPFLQQYFRYIRPGAKRIDADSRVEALDPMAFVNPDGRWTVVVKADEASSFAISGLPPGDYGVTYTVGPDAKTPREAGVDAGSVTISENQPLQASIPQRGVITIFGR
jgi:O-glycosyl hydrolase